MVILDFATGGNQAARNYIFAIFTALTQSFFQRPAIRWQNENADCVRKFLLDLGRALHVNIEQQVAALQFRFLQEAAGGSVIISEDFGIFEKLAVLNHLLELGPRYKIILPSISFAATRSSSGVGNGEFQIAHRFQQFIDES